MHDFKVGDTCRVLSSGATFLVHLLEFNPRKTYEWKVHILAGQGSQAPPVYYLRVAHSELRHLSALEKVLYA